VSFAFAAAGTGGHVYPALAVADALRDAGVARHQILFIGGSRMEATTVPAAGYDYLEVEIRGLKRSLSLDNVTLPSVVWRASKRIERELRGREISVVIAFGGYVSVPAAWAARRADARLFVQEQNAVPGIANRIVARRAEQCFIAFPDAAERLNRTSLVGNPLRSAIATFDRSKLRHKALQRYGMSSRTPVLGVLGGSLGAKVLNEVAERVVDAHDPNELAILHLTGHAHHKTIHASAANSPHQWYVLPFEDHMEYFYAAADVVLSRAGALTISELAATGTPAVVVPYSAGAASHQAANAVQLAGNGGALVVEEKEIDTVPALLQQLIADADRRSAMGAAAASIGMPGAAQSIAAALLEAGNA